MKMLKLLKTTLCSIVSPSLSYDIRIIRYVFRVLVYCLRFLCFLEELRVLGVRFFIAYIDSFICSLAFVGIDVIYLGSSITGSTREL